MMSDYHIGFLHFFSLSSSSPKFFGFAEFLAGLALMVLAWTIADVRYRFRVRTTPLPLQGLTFAVVGSVGVLTLLTDLWRAEQWLVPRGSLLTPPQWQALLGGVFLLTFLTWAWYAFIHPPIFGRRNAKRYARVLYRIILKGSPSELSVIADEFALSVKPLIRYATNKQTTFNEGDAEKAPEKRPEVVAYADDILLLMADKRFCRGIVESSPGTALTVFQEIADTKKYCVQVGIFGKNIVHED